MNCKESNECFVQSVTVHVVVLSVMFDVFCGSIKLSLSQIILPNGCTLNVYAFDHGS